MSSRRAYWHYVNSSKEVYEQNMSSKVGEYESLKAVSSKQVAYKQLFGSKISNIEVDIYLCICTTYMLV